MSTMNPFQFEAVVRQRQTEIEAQLRRHAQISEALSQPARPAPARTFRAALIVAATAAVSLLTALGISYTLAFALAMAR